MHVAGTGAGKAEAGQETKRSLIAGAKPNGTVAGDRYAVWP